MAEKKERKKKKKSDYESGYVKHPENEVLAKRYFDVKTMFSRAGENNIPRQYKNRIASAEINIEEFFLTNKDYPESLTGLKIKGIGKDTIHIMELILQEGLKKAKLIYSAEESEKRKGKK